MQTFEQLEDLIDSCNFYGPLTVADFGSGAGFFAIPIARRISGDGKIYALDIQEPPLEALRKKARGEYLNRIQTMRADLETPRGSRLKDESADWVVMANILFQAPDKQAILNEAYRILKKGGKMLIVEWTTKSQALLGPRHEVRIEPEKLKSWLASSRLAIAQEFSLGDFHYGVIAVKSQ